MADVDMDCLKAKYKHLKDVNIPNIPLSQPGILIGLEHSKLGIMYDVREGSWDEPVASKTRLGWVIHGKEKSSSSAEYNCCQCDCNNSEESLNNLHETVRHFFTTESFGVKLLKNNLESDEIERARKIQKETTTKVGEKFETGLLWKKDSSILPNNKNVALKRLVCFEQKLLRNPPLLEAVNKKIISHIENNYIEKLTDSEIKKISDHCWYLPIFSITNPNKPNKLRLVFDAAAKCDGISLNDVLMKGPDQLASLFGVLLRFREGTVAISADIAEMFHRIQIIKNDQNFQLILWRNADQSKVPDVYRMKVMTFGATCSTSSAQFVKNYNASQYSDTYPRAVQSIINRHYVDDLLDSFENKNDAIETAKNISFIHAQAGFNIRNWLSNCPDVMRIMNPTHNSEEDVVDLNISTESVTEKVLGLYWCISSDEFLFKLNFSKVDVKIIDKLKIPTKREVLKLVMSLFDPLGFVSIISICAKIIMQDIWRSGIDWDEKINEEMVQRWYNWIDGLKNLNTFRISRCMSIELMKAEHIELHIFSDASEDAFAAVAYLRICNLNSDDVDTSLVAAKTKVAPQKGLTINRLELQGCVMATRMKDSLISELSVKIHTVYFWTDSQTALGWIRSVRRKYGPFVSHRIGEILDASNVNQWRWVPSIDNVADDITHEMENPKVSERWLSGPKFLRQNPNSWPIEKVRVVTTEEEIKSVQKHHEIANMFNQIQPERFSKWERLLRSTVYVIRYIKILKARVGNSYMKS